MSWKDESVLVTGGASFIGSHLVDKLLSLGAQVVVANDFSSRRLSDLEYPLKKHGTRVWTYKALTVKKGDLKDKRFARSVTENIDSVLHLAASLQC